MRSSSVPPASSASPAVTDELEDVAAVAVGDGGHALGQRVELVAGRLERERGAAGDALLAAGVEAAACAWRGDSGRDRRRSVTGGGGRLRPCRARHPARPAPPAALSPLAAPSLCSSRPGRRSRRRPLPSFRPRARRRRRSRSAARRPRRRRRAGRWKTTRPAWAERLGHEPTRTATRTGSPPRHARAAPPRRRGRARASTRAAAPARAPAARARSGSAAVTACAARASSTLAKSRSAVASSSVIAGLA